MLIGLIIASIIDVAAAALLIAVSGFVFGSGPESADAGAPVLAASIAAILICLAAPVAGFVMRAKGRGTYGLLLAWLPAGAALAALLFSLR